MQINSKHLEDFINIQTNSPTSQSHHWSFCGKWPEVLYSWITKDKEPDKCTRFDSGSSKKAANTVRGAWYVTLGTVETHSPLKQWQRPGEEPWGSCSNTKHLLGETRPNPTHWLREFSILPPPCTPPNQTHWSHSTTGHHINIPIISPRSLAKTIQMYLAWSGNKQLNG